MIRASPRDHSRGDSCRFLTYCRTVAGKSSFDSDGRVRQGRTEMMYTRYAQRKSQTVRKLIVVVKLAALFASRRMTASLSA